MNKKMIFLIIIAVVLMLFIIGIFVGNNEESDKPATSEVTETGAAKEADFRTEPTDVRVAGVEVWHEEPEETKTASTEPQNENTESTQPTKEATTEPTTEHTTDPTTEPTTATEDDAEENSTYEWYLSISPEKQQEFFNTFESPDAFFAWYNAAKAEYEASQDYIDISGDPSVDLEEIIGGNS